MVWSWVRHVCVRWVLLWTYGGSFREHLLSLSNSSKYVSLRASGFLQPPTLLGLTGVGCGASCGPPGGLWGSYSERRAGTGRRPAWDGSRVTGRPVKRRSNPCASTATLNSKFWSKSGSRLSGVWVCLTTSETASESVRLIPVLGATHFPPQSRCLIVELRPLGGKT